MKELKAGEYCYAGSNKEKRIWLGCFNGRNLCVLGEHESDFKNGEDFQTDTWNICTPIPDEPTYEYQWTINGIVKYLEFSTEKELEEFPNLGYQKIESTKRVRK